MVQVEQAQQHVSVQQNVSVPPAAIRLLSLAARFATERTPFEVKRRGCCCCAAGGRDDERRRHEPAPHWAAPAADHRHLVSAHRGSASPADLLAHRAPRAPRGTSKKIQPVPHPDGPMHQSGAGPQLLWKAQFQTTCGNFCEGKKSKERKYLHSEPLSASRSSAVSRRAVAVRAVRHLFLRAVYDNKLESNTPYDLCGPCTCSDKCVYDYTVVTYFDRSPFRTSSTSQTCFIPMTCCGPPVIYSAEKKCCGGALSSEGFAGVPVYAAPCNMLNLKKSES